MPSGRIRKVFLVREGAWGLVTREDADRMIELYERQLRECKRVESCVVDTLEEAGDAAFAGDVVVVNSRSLLDQARELASRRSTIHVVLITGLIPDGEITFIPKSATGNLHFFETLVCAL